MNILDKRFRWNPACRTDVTILWRQHGWRPTTPEERQERQERIYGKQQQKEQAK